MNQVDVQYMIWVFGLLLLNLAFLVGLCEGSEDAAFGSGYTVKGFGCF
jgi:hypothetical protein